MEELNIKELTGGYKERMRRLALMDVLVELGRKRVNDQQGTELDMRGLGMLTLLFFFERRLARQYKTGTRHLALFLQEMLRDVNLLDEGRAMDLARTLITAFRPASGNRRRFSFFNWETRQEEAIEYSILKDHGFDTKTNSQYYTLDEDGLELIFATKEFYSEFQISINQLLLRQQIKKGEFHGALRQVREMDMEVEKLQERLVKVKMEILRSIASEDTLERYKQLLEDTLERLELENEEFSDLSQFITETYDLISSGKLEKKVDEPYELLLVISRELEEVHDRHGELLKHASELRMTALQTAQESLYYTGVESFNFDKDLVALLLSGPYPSEAMAGSIQPFLQVEENRIWSPLAVFWDQQLKGERRETKETTYLEAVEHDAEEERREQLNDKYGEIMESFLTAYEAGGARTLEDFIGHLEAADEQMILDRDFYRFWLLVHQRSPVRMNNDELKSNERLLEKALSRLQGRTLHILEMKEVLHPVPQYSIQNLKLELQEEDRDGLF